ncbi:MAG TPA: aminodeoxychorismate synthase component I, partial [Gammaproteobacteria bacterium]|nr:aminodeoxychorismate synthase component I [Gammaproteobacteria bacterium]
MSLKLTELTYQRDSSDLFSRIAAEPWSVFFDSGFPNIDTGRYDVIAGRPFKTITTVGETTTVTDQSGKQYNTTEDPFGLVRDLLGDREKNLTGLPFCGGAMGYYAYDLGRRIEQLPETATHDIHLPDMAIGLYDWVVIIDHQQRKSSLVSCGR